MRLGRLACMLLSVASSTRRLCNFELGCMLKTPGASMHSERVRSRSSPILQSYRGAYLWTLRSALKHHPRQRALKHQPRWHAPKHQHRQRAQWKSRSECWTLQLNQNAPQESPFHPVLRRSLPNRTTKPHLPQVCSLLVSPQPQSDLPQEQHRWPKTFREQHHWPVHWDLWLDLQVRWNLFPE